MGVKWVVFILMSWIIVSLLVGVVENVMIGGGIDTETGQPLTQTVLNRLMTSHVITAQSLGAKIAWAVVDTQFWGAIGSMITFDFPAIFYGGYIVFQWVFFLPFALGFGICLTITLTRGASSD